MSFYKGTKVKIKNKGIPFPMEGVVVDRVADYIYLVEYNIGHTIKWQEFIDHELEEIK